MFPTRTYDFIASVESFVRFHSEIFYAKPKEFIRRQTDRTIHGKTMSRPVVSWVAFGAQVIAFQ